MTNSGCHRVFDEEAERRISVCFGSLNYQASLRIADLTTCFLVEFVTGIERDVGAADAKLAKLRQLLKRREDFITNLGVVEV